MKSKFPFQSYSWSILNENKYVKRMDKSSFLHHGTGIPKNIASYWSADGMTINQKRYIKVLYNEDLFIMYISTDQFNRFRLFWEASFSKVIEDRFNEIHEMYSRGDSFDNTPEMVFTKITKEIYSVEFVESIYNVAVEKDYNITELKEGKVLVYFGKKYERDKKAREIAIKIHGYDCHACGFNFEKRYGIIGKEFIEVHHIRPLYINSKEVIVDPRKDLITVCSNCHRIIHRKRHYVYSINKIKQYICRR